MEKIRFCLIGAGRAGMVHARNIFHNIQNAELTAIIENNEKLLEERGRELQIKNLFKDVDSALSKDLFDAVVIGAPTFSHHDFTVKCAKAKKHVFCEKPMAVTEADAGEMIKASKENNVKLQIAFKRLREQLKLQVVDYYQQNPLLHLFPFELDFLSHLPSFAYSGEKCHLIRK